MPTLAVALLMVTVLVSGVSSIMALVHVHRLRLELGLREEKKTLRPAERSPELCLFEQLVTTYEPKGGSYRGYEIEVPAAKEKRRFRGQTNKVTMDLERNTNKVKVSFDGNEYIFEDEEQEEARRIYDLAAAKSRAAAMLVLADGEGS